jgi:hypothetical protein
MARVARPGIHGIHHAGGGGGGVLGVQRQHEDAAHASILQGLQLRGNRRLAVAHGRQHLGLYARLAQPAAQHHGLLVRPYRQGRALVGPDAGVLGGRLRRPRAQDDAVQYRQPGGARYLDHARVGEELRQVAAQRRCGGGIGRAQVAEQDGSVMRGARGRFFL